MLTNLKIKHLKPFKSASINFRPLTLLTGGNNTGKSSLFSAIRPIAEYRLTNNKYHGWGIDYTFSPQLNPVSVMYFCQQAYYKNKYVMLHLKAISDLIFTLPKDTILLLEQPEAGLDAKSQTELGRLLTSLPAKGIQIIVETHSDHLFNSIRVEVNKWAIDADDVATHYLTVNDCGLTEVETLQIDHNGRYAYWPKGFFDEYDNNTEKLLIKSKRSE